MWDVSGTLSRRTVILGISSIALLAFVWIQVSVFQSTSKSVGVTYRKSLQSVLWSKPLQAPRYRTDIADLLEREKFQVGVELGVQTGDFASHNLAHWQSCKRYYLVDIWRSQANYKDLANVNNEAQEAFYRRAKEILKPWSEKTVFLRNTTLEAVSLIQEPLDFVYVDARHDYCGAKEDILAYWPKLKPGGIMAGHDYLSAPEVPPGQDWSVCLDGSQHQGAVKGAVNEFAESHNLTVVVTYNDPPWSSWLIRKPEVL